MPLLAVGVLRHEAAEPPPQIGRANAPDANLQPLGLLLALEPLDAACTDFSPIFKPHHELFMPAE